MDNNQILRIGILITNDFNHLQNWELRIIQGIMDDPNLELALLMQDGRRVERKPDPISKKIGRLIKNPQALSKFLFHFQTQFENRFIKEKITVDKTKIISHLEKIPCLKLYPKIKGFLDIFEEKEAKEVADFNLDIILRHEFNIIRGPILTAAKHGIWSFHHGDNAINRGGPPGLWEVILDQPSIGVTLQQLTPELDGGLVIDKAYFDKSISFLRGSKEIYESSVILLFRSINRLKRNKHNPTKSLAYYNPLYKAPDLKNTFKYLKTYYSFLAKQAFKKIDIKLTNSRYDCWTLFIGKGNFMNATLFRLKPIKLPEGEFWADPFILNHQGSNYVFFENYSYKTHRGKISCGKIVKNKLVDICDVLDLDYHLSFPFIFKEDGEIFMMPETSQNKRLEVYKCVEFPNKWELYSTAFEGESILDAHFYDDSENNKWLFLNKSTETTPTNSELYIYKVDSVKMNTIEAHQDNPVVINSQTARNGGAIFTYDGELYRPSQYNADCVYGKGLNVNKIKKLSLTEYEEENTLRVLPNFKKGLSATHHLHQTDKLFVIDAAYKRKPYK